MKVADVGGVGLVYDVLPRSGDLLARLQDVLHSIDEMALRKRADQTLRSLRDLAG